jgi:hypothetical protein
MSNGNKGVGNTTESMSQCPTCGSVVPPDQIETDAPLYEAKIFIFGLILGGFLSQLSIWFQVN